MKCMRNADTSGITAGHPKFKLPVPDKCQEVSRGLYRLSFEDRGKGECIFIRVGMAMCFLRPNERHNVVFNTAKMTLNEYTKKYQDTVENPDSNEVKRQESKLAEAEKKCWRGWLCKILFMSAVDAEPLLSVYIDPYEFNHQCIHLDSPYAGERLFNLAMLMWAAYYYPGGYDDGTSANEIVMRIQKQCEDTVGSLSMYDMDCCVKHTEEVFKETIALALDDTMQSHFFMISCHARLSLDWIRKKYHVVPYVKPE